MNRRIARLNRGAVSLSLVLAALAPASASAFPNPLHAGVARGQTWVVCQGYNNTSITHRAGTINQYALDLTAGLADVGRDGCYGNPSSTAGREVVAPGNGVVTWRSGDAVCVNLDAGDSFMLAHFSGVGQGARVTGGQPIGTVNPPNTGANGPYAHLHIAAFRGPGCTSANRTPFTGSARLTCAPDMPSNGSYNQWAGTTLKNCSNPSVSRKPDFTGDGRADLLYMDPGSSVMRLLSSSGSSFAGASAWASGMASPAWQVAGDFNGDGRSDLAYQDSNSTNIRVLTSGGTQNSSNSAWVSGMGMSAWRVA